MTYRFISQTFLTMLMALSFPLSIVSADTAQKAFPQKGAAKEISDFGVSDIEVQSVKTLDHDKLNAEVRTSASKGENWTKDAVLVAFKVAGSGLKGHTKIIEVRTPPEQRDNATITITESGHLDDAVSGERWKVWLQKGTDGTWIIKQALWAQLWSRPGKRFYSAEKCL